jgi:hypothetical protein
MQDIFQKACLLKLTLKIWTGTKRLDPIYMERLGESEWLKGRKNLVDPEYLNPIKTTAGQARAFVKKHALPFPINGLQLVPKESISYIESNLQEYEHMFNSDVQRFIFHFEDAITEARQVLGDIFDPLDYPTDVQERFGFSWQYVELGLPGRHSVLSPELYRREKEKFQNLMEQTRDEALLALRQEFSELVGHLTERLTPNGEKPKVIRRSVMDKMEEFLYGFEHRNIFEDEQLSELVQTTRALLNGVDLKDLKNDEYLREYVRGDMSDIKQEIDEAIEDAPRRRIVLAA